MRQIGISNAYIFLTIGTSRTREHFRVFQLNASGIKSRGEKRRKSNGPRRNFKGDDSPSGTDLSARLSFAKRAREVKAANEAAVFKEDYPRDDKSIEDDERPNRSRVSEPLGTYRKSISDGEKSGEEADERPGDVGDTGDARTSRAADERPRELNERRDEVVRRETGCGPADVSTPGIKRKRISRGVQCVSIGRHGHPGRSLFGCFKSRSRSLARRAGRRGASANKFDVGSRSEAEGAPGMINDESRDAAKEGPKSTRDTGAKGKKLGKIGAGKMEGIARGNDEEARNPYNGEDDDSKRRGVKRSLLETLRRRRVSDKDDSKAGRGGSPHESRSREGETAGLGYEARKRADNSRKIRDRQMSDGREIVATEGVDGESDANKIKERLDSCIAELNGIIGDACAIFDNGRNGRTRNNGRGC